MSKSKDEYPRPSLTADVVVVARDGSAPRILFIRRARDPYAGMWALPGGFVEPTETVAEAAVRELREETSLEIGDAEVEELGCFSKPGRDPRGWVVSVAHLTIVPAARVRDAKAGDDAADTAWLELRIQPGGGYELWHEGARVPALAFDHGDIMARAAKRIAALGASA